MWRLFFFNYQSLAFPKPGQVSPSYNQSFTIISIPVRFKIEMTLFTQPGTIVVAIATLQRLDTGIE
jgi:hypothetical protein